MVRLHGGASPDPRWSVIEVRHPTYPNGMGRSLRYAGVRAEGNGRVLPGSTPGSGIGPHGCGRPNQLSRGMFRSSGTPEPVREREELPRGEETAVSGFKSRLVHWVATNASDSMSTEATENRGDNMDWRQEIVAEQSRGVPKERGRTYYYADGLFDRKQMWLKHNPGCDISMRVTKVWQPGIFDDPYDSSLQMNIGTEMDAYRLYRALEAYFNDVRTPPWFLQDVEVSD